MSNKQNQNQKNYLMLVEFCSFLRQNGDKLFDKDSKLSLRNDQLVVLHEYLQQIIHKDRINHEPTDKYSRKKSSVVSLANTKEFILLYQSSQLHFIQDFLFKITSLKITSNFSPTCNKDSIRLNIFGSITYLEIKNIPILNIYDLENLRKQLETLIVFKSINKVQELIQSCGADQSSPLSWPKLSTLTISYNNLSILDDSLRLAASIEVLDLSHNNLKNCSFFLHNLPKLKRLNLSFNKLEEIPSLSESESNSQLEYLDLSYNNIEKLNAPNLSKLGNLKAINLSNNLISTLIELTNIRFLSNLKEISLNKNPVKLNPNCEQTIMEILENIKIKSSFKQSLQATNLSWANFQNYQLKTSSGPKKILRKITIDDNNSDEDSLKYSKLKMKRGASSLRLKANNILIEQNDDESSDYIIINKKNDSDCEQDKSQISSSLLSSYLQSDKIQNELDYYKQMRQKYGTGWLSVLPNEDKDQKSSVKSEINKINESENEFNMETQEYLKLNGKIIESFVVSRTLELNQIDQLFNGKNTVRDEMNENTEMCILCLGEQYLLEKDENNSLVIGQYEYSSLSEIIEMTKIKKFIKEIESENKYEVKMKFKDLSSSRIYEFDTKNELMAFIECISEILLNKFNIEKCDLYYCKWCNEFGKKSAFILDESNENLSNEEILKFEEKKCSVTCTKCNKTLNSNSETLEIHEILTPKNSCQGSPITTKNNFNLDLNEVVTKFDENLVKYDTSSVSTNQDETFSLNSSNQDAEMIENVTIEQRLKYLFSFDQSSKQKLEEITNRAKKINNNLKLFLIIKVLSEMKINDGAENQEESVLYAYKLKYSFFSVTKLTNECLCIFTNMHLLIFEIKDMEKFNENVDFDKCMVQVACIDINQIEIIEIAITQNYLILNVINNEEFKLVYKLVTNDVYQNQALLNSLLRTINESKKATMLKQIKKRNNVTFKNLEEIVNLVQQINIGTDNDDNLLFSSKLNLFLHLDKLEIAGSNALINGSIYENCCYSMFIYNNDQIFIVEENLSYMSSQNKNEQFTLVSWARINDMVQMKLFKHDETRIEINILDESSNSAQIKWIIKMNKTFQLSQFIYLIKDLWEKIFFVELPISF